jgi:hypothetical protein
MTELLTKIIIETATGNDFYNEISSFSNALSAFRERTTSDVLATFGIYIDSYKDTIEFYRITGDANPDTATSAIYKLLRDDISYTVLKY